MAEDRHNPLNQEPATPSSPEPEDNLIDHVPEPQQQEFESFVDDLMGGGSEPPEVPDDEPVIPTGPVEPEPVAAHPAEIPQTPQEPTAPEVEHPAEPAEVPTVPQPRYRVGDQLLTAQEIIEQGHFNDIMMRAQQAQQPAQPEPQQPQALTSDVLAAQMQPHVDQMIRNGFISGDFADSFPQEAAGYAYLVNIVNQLTSQVTQSSQFVSQQARRQEVNEAGQFLDSQINEAAAAGGIYADMAKNAEFRQWVIDYLNPQMGQVNPEFLQYAWVGYHRNMLNTLQTQAAQSPTAPIPPEIAQARAENGSARMGQGPAAPVPQWADLLEGTPLAYN